MLLDIVSGKISSAPEVLVLTYPLSLLFDTRSRDLKVEL